MNRAVKSLEPRPHRRANERRHDRNGYHDIGENASGQTVPGLIAYRFYAPLLFSSR